MSEKSFYDNNEPKGICRTACEVDGFILPYMFLFSLPGPHS